MKWPNLTTRFPQVQLITAMILDPSNLPEDDNEYENYGGVTCIDGESKTVDTTVHPPLVDSTTCKSGVETFGTSKLSMKEFRK